MTDLKRFLLLIIGWWMCLYAGAATGNGKGVVSALPADSVKICQLLSKVRQQPATANVPLFFARQFLGVPYVAYTLEKFSSERLIVNTRELDCPPTLIEECHSPDALRLSPSIHVAALYLPMHSGICAIVRARQDRLYQPNPLLHSEWITPPFTTAKGHRQRNRGTKPAVQLTPRRSRSTI